MLENRLERPALQITVSVKLAVLQLGLLLTAPIGCGGDRAGPGAGNPGAARQQEQKGDNRAGSTDGQEKPKSTMIDQLANKNKRPTIKNKREHPDFPADYDWAEQARVIESWKMVHERADELLGELVDHLDDDRYALTYQSGVSDYWWNMDVGDICQIVLRETIECYQLPPGVLLDTFVPDAHDEVRKWWNPRKARTLLELQTEMIEYTLKTLSDSAESGGEREKHMHAYFGPRLTAIADELRASGKPIRRKFSLDLYRCKNYPLERGRE